MKLTTNTQVFVDGVMQANAMSASLRQSKEEKCPSP